MKTWKRGDVLTAIEMNRIEANIKAVEDAIPSITHLATKTEVENHVTGAEVQDMINTIPPVDLSVYATKSYVTSVINEAILAGSDIDIDLTPYALATDLNNKVDKVTGKGLSTNDLTNALKTKLEGIEAGAQKNPDLSQYALKSDIKDATQMEFNGVPLEGLRRYMFEVEAVEGEWSINYSDKNFTQFVTVSFYSIAKGTALADRTIPTLKQGQPTLTSCSGYLMSASSAGLLAAMTLVNGSGTVRVIVEGV